MFLVSLHQSRITKLYLNRVLGILAPIKNYKTISESCSWYPSTNQELLNYIWIVFLVSLHQSRITKLYLNRVLGILAPIQNYKTISESCSWYPSTNPELQNYIWIVFLVSLHQSRITKLYLNRVLGILAPIQNYKTISESCSWYPSTNPEL